VRDRASDHRLGPGEPKGPAAESRAKRGENREGDFPAEVTPYTAVPLAPPARPSDEADLSAQEAQASPDPWFPGAERYPLRSGDPAAPASEGPQATHPLTLSSKGRPDARRRRLSRSGDFDRVYREGNSRGNRFLVLYSFARREDDASDGARLGLSVGRKIGKAVTRNKVKRAIRESFWELSEGLEAGHDYVIVARPGVEGLLEREGQSGLRSSLAELVEDSDRDPEHDGEERLS
jgi:ribonuclease P protein component